MAKKSALRIRFVFDAQGGKSIQRAARQRFANNFAQQMVESVAFRYSENMYQDLSGRLEAQFVADARKELVHMAALFRRHITGSSPSNTPTGTLNTVVGDAATVSIKQSVPSWEPRTTAYLKYKQRVAKNNNWWDGRGMQGNRKNKYSGLKKNTNADVWMSMFGPIRATFTKSAAASGSANVPGSAALKQFVVAPGHFKIAVGTLKVYALTKLTPEMIPALTSGDPRTINPATRDGNPGLMTLVKGVDKDMYNRLDGRSSRATGSIYRPTLEPFLAYYLTRSVPAAIKNRLSEGVMSVRRRRTN